MNDGVLVVVHCWAGDRPNVERLLPLWKHHGRLVLLVSPQDAPLMLDPPTTISGGASDGVFCRAAGGNGWIGTHVLHRLIAHWKIALEYQADWFFINEWDTFCTTPELPAELFTSRDVFWSIEVDEKWAIDEVTSGLRLSFPYFMSRPLLRRLVDEAEAVVADVTAGPNLPLFGNTTPDGFVTHLVKSLGLKHQSYADCEDNRAWHDGPVPRIVHWHGLKDPALALLAAGHLEGV